MPAKRKKIKKKKIEKKENKEKKNKKKGKNFSLTPFQEREQKTRKTDDSSSSLHKIQSKNIQNNAKKLNFTLFFFSSKKKQRF